MSSRRAFTLIELLVVIAVIAVLMGILMPALKKAREQAQSLFCRGNLKTYTLAVPMFAQDNDDKFPNSGTCYFKAGEPTKAWQRWCNADANLTRYPEKGSEFFRKYLSTGKTMICPTFKRIAIAQIDASRTAKWDEVVGGITYEPWMNYTQNAYLGPMASVAVKTSQVKGPSTVVTFVDEGPFRDEPINIQGLNETSLWPLWFDSDPITKLKDVVNKAGSKWAVKPPFVDVIGGFHNAPTGNLVAGKGNCAFVDGHVAAVSRLDSFAVCWPLSN